MDSLLVSLASSELQVRQRVAVNTDSGWYIGSVKLVKTKYALVVFDDGDSVEIPKVGGAADFRVLPKDTPKSKKAYKATEIRAMLQNKAVKSKAIKAEPDDDDGLDDKHTVREAPMVAPLPPKPQVPRMRVIGGKVSAPVHDQKPQPVTDHAATAVDQLKIIYETQIRASTNIPTIRRFMLDLWTAYNKEMFSGHLRPVKKFLIIPPAGRSGTRAFWHSGYRILVFTTLVMKSKWEKFSEIFLHELCHQAVTDVNHGGKAVPVGPDGGHGPDWAAWMTKVGLAANRYDYSTFSEYMTDDERELFERNADNAMSEYALAIVRKKEQYDDMKAQKLHPVKDALIGALITFSDGTADEAAEGVVTHIRQLANGANEYKVHIYTDALKGKVYMLDEKDPERPLFFIREPKMKYRATARRWAEEARKIARKEGRSR